jgi:hypothetical protein
MHAMKAYEGVEAYLHSFLTLALGGGELSTLGPATSLPMKTPQVPIE